jgi:hypothetical protein
MRRSPQRDASSKRVRLCLVLQSPGPSEDALLELGRVAWAAINLEDRVYWVCRILDRPPHALGGDPPISSRIAQVQAKLLTEPDDPAKQGMVEWLSAAEEALRLRNSVMHSTPATFEPLPGTEPIPGLEKDWLMHFPRNAKRPPVRTPFTADSLRNIRIELETATEGWVEAVGGVLGWDSPS